jgi:hypothetical protein
MMQGVQQRRSLNVDAMPIKPIAPVIVTGDELPHPRRANVDFGLRRLK